MKTNIRKSKLVWSVIFIILVSMFIISGVLAGCAASGDDGKLSEINNGEILTPDSETPKDPQDPELLAPLNQSQYEFWLRYGRTRAFLTDSQDRVRRLRLNPEPDGRYVVRYRIECRDGETPMERRTRSEYVRIIQQAMEAINRITNSDAEGERLDHPIHFELVVSTKEHPVADTGFNLRIADYHIEPADNDPGHNELNNDDYHITSSTITLYSSRLGRIIRNPGAGQTWVNWVSEDGVVATMLRMLGQTLGLQNRTEGALTGNSIMYFPGSLPENLLTQFTPFDIAGIRWRYTNIHNNSPSNPYSAYAIWYRRNSRQQNEDISYHLDGSNGTRLYRRLNITTVNYYLDTSNSMNSQFRYTIQTAINELDRVTSQFNTRIRFSLTTEDSYSNSPFRITVSSDYFADRPHVHGVNHLNFSGSAPDPRLDANVAGITGSHIHLSYNHLSSMGVTSREAINLVLHELLHTLGLRDLYERDGHNDPDYHLLRNYSVMTSGSSDFPNITPYDIANLVWYYNGDTPSADDFTGRAAGLFQTPRPTQTRTPSTPTPIPSPTPDSADLSISQTNFGNYSIYGRTNAVIHTGGATGQSVAEDTDDRKDLVRLPSDIGTVTYNYKFDVSTSDNDAYVWAIGQAMSMINWYSARYLKTPIKFQTGSLADTGDFIIRIQGTNRNDKNLPGMNNCDIDNNGYIKSSHIYLFNNAISNEKGNVDEEYIYCVMLNLLGETMGLATLDESALKSNSVMCKSQLERNQGIMRYTAYDIANLRWLYDNYESKPADFQSISMWTPVSFAAPKVSPEYQYELWTKGWGGAESFGISEDNKLKGLKINTEDQTKTVTYHLFVVKGGLKDEEQETYIKAIKRAMEEINKVTRTLKHKISFELDSKITYIDKVPQDPDKVTEKFNIYIYGKPGATLASHNDYDVNSSGEIWRSSISLYSNLLNGDKDSICAETLHSLMYTLGLAPIRVSEFWSNSVMYIEAVQRLTELTAFDIANIRWRYDGYTPENFEEFFVGKDGPILLTTGTEGLQYKLNSDGRSYTVTGIGMATGDITIPFEYDGLPITGIGYKAFMGCGSITSITIPSSVHTIGAMAFAECTKLKSIYISKSVIYIGSRAFSGCTALESISVDYKNKVFESSDDCLIETASKTLVLGCKNSIIPTDGSVTSIGYEAFAECTGLTSITIPKSVTTIGEAAFRGCTSLEAILIPKSVTSIGAEAFWGCTSLRIVKLPTSVTYIGTMAFTDCTALRTIMIPKSVTTINIATFWGCTSLTSVSIQEGVTTIGDSAFYGCISLINGIIIPNSVTTIGDSAFYGCTSLKKIDIPNEVTSIGRNAFADCKSLLNIYYSQGTRSQWDAIEKGVNWDKNTPNYTIHYHSRGDELSDGTEGLKYVMNSDEESYSVENIGTATDKDIIIASEYENLPVTGIKSSAFKDCTFIRSIDIPDSVTIIGEYAFYGCTSLESIDIPDSVTSIGNYAFEGCSVLSSIYFYGTKAQWDEITKGTDWDKNTGDYTIHYLGDELNHNGTEGLKYVLNSDRKSYSVENIGTATDKDIVIASEYEGLPVTCIENYAFKDCTFITSITIPDSVTIIREFAFYGCTSLASIYIPNSVIAIGSYAFSGCASLTSVVIPNGVTSIEYCAFSGCTSLTSVVIPNGVKSIGGDAFSGCASLTSIVIPNGVTYIGGEAFDGCSSLTSVTIPDSVTSIGIGIFRDCTSLSSVIISNSIKSIENYTFESCTSLTSIVIPDSVTIIGEFAFFGCKSLTSVVIPDSVTVIGEAAFVVCTSLTSVVIPDSVTLIEIDAFAECSALTDIYYEGTKAQWDEIKKEEDWDRATGKYTVHYLGDVTEGLNYLLNEDGKSYSVENIGTATDKDIVIPSEYEGLPVTAIGSYAFKDCTFITSVYIPDSVTVINPWTFGGCTSLTSVTIPRSVAYIRTSTFYGCSALKSINFKGTKEQWEKIIKSHEWNTNTGNYTIHCTDGNIAKG